MRKLSSHLRRMFVGSALTAMVLALAACGTNDKLTTPSLGVGPNSKADFTSFVAIGNSLTAGYQSAALTKLYSPYSFPALIAEQAGVATFVGPQISEPGIGAYTPRGAGRLSLDLATLNISPIPLSPAQAANPASMLENATYPAPYNNLGIPQMLAVEATTATSTANSISHSPFFDLILRNPALGNTTTLEQALLLHPTFATVWLGNNDVLLWALSGGTAPGLPSPKAEVSSAIDAVVAGLKNAGANVAIANIPNIRDIPYFTTIKPYLTDPMTGTPILNPQTNGTIPLIGPTGQPLSPQDMVLLAAKDSLAVGTGIPPGIPGAPSSGRPLPGDLILDASEQSTVATKVSEYNDAIAQIATAHGCALVDINALFSTIAKHGYQAGGVSLTASMVTGGLFGLDGIHPNSVGNGVLANEFITSINETFDAELPLVNLSTLMGK